MNSRYLTINFLSRSADRRDDFQLVWLRGWARVSAVLRSHTSLAALAILATLGLILAFYQVVLGAVAQGESLQQARNLQSAAVWRCNGLRGSVERDNCLRQAYSIDSAGTGQ